jgi:hypothetical protein
VEPTLLASLALTATRSTILPVVAIPASFLFVYLMARAGAADKDRKARRELLGRALESGALDDALKRELLSSVAEARPRSEPRPRTPWSVALGWIAFCVGIALMFLDGSFEGGAITAAAGFALLSMPFAARELEARRLPGHDSRRAH